MTLRVFALTGGIGSGKSAVANYWRSLGLPVIDADRLAREVVAPGSAGLSAIVQQFGEQVLTESGELDRKCLGQLVFNHPEQRKTLERLLHPRIRQAASEEFKALDARGEPLACYEVPLLFETGQEELYRPVVVVSVHPETQVVRVAARDRLPEEAIRARIAAQMPLAEKAAQADYVIENDGPLESTLKRAGEVLEAIQKDLRDS